MEDVELLLSDEFAAFTDAIKSIREHKKEEQEKFKELYEEYKSKMDVFEQEANAAQKKWEEWKSSQGVKSQAKVPLDAEKSKQKK
jgi:hypothetical protein